MLLLLRDQSLAMALLEGPGFASVATEPTRPVELLLFDYDDPFEDESLDVSGLPEVLPEPPQQWLPDCDKYCGCCWLGLAVFARLCPCCCYCC